MREADFLYAFSWGLLLASPVAFWLGLLWHRCGERDRSEAARQARVDRIVAAYRASLHPHGDPIVHVTAPDPITAWARLTGDRAA